MMICPECGHETSGNFCSNCGALLKTGKSPDTHENTYRRRSRAQNSEVYETAAGEDETAAAANRSTMYGRCSDESVGGDSWAAINDGPARRNPERQESNNAESRAERRANSRKKDKPKRTSSSKDSGKSGPGKKEVRLEQKEKKLRENRISSLESEVERLTVQERLRDRRRWDQDEERDGDSGPDLGEMAAKGAAGVVLIAARVMQLASFFMMGIMVLIMARSFLKYSEGLGDISVIAAEHNYGLALYVGVAGVSLFMGVIWCLWILSRKGAGGGFRLKKYDTGRGLIPFILCGAAIFAAGPALTLLPPVEDVVGQWQGIVMGAKAVLTAVNVHRGTLLFCSGAGAVMSLIRRILLV
ncbi:zinc ribbon domain-containing protein [Clostridium transplantifaecale]|uniref:zinc ribbon domain-containing protein n=1 Tax=Clostridium transplantifaecale TaxID=2479838 RepID=UPI001FAA61E1|nr:zinc ribbon domain-containing protein [Clostridium transplantifaecale]